MTPMEKAERALNDRIARLQVRLHETPSDTARRHLIQAVVVCVALSEGISDYVRTVQQYAQTRYGELKEEQAALTTRHAGLLDAGKELLEQLKADPADPTVRREIEEAQRAMATIQKTLRKSAETLQREVSPSIRRVDEIAEAVSRLCRAEERNELGRPLRLMISQVQALYRGHPNLPAKGIIDAQAWEASALASIQEATEFDDAHARAGFQVLVALEVMTLAVSPAPPETAEDATRRANEAVAQRIGRITARLGSPDTPGAAGG
jgi:hypothetical protein